MITAEQYLEKKAKGLAWIEKLNDAYVLYVRRFNAETGDELEPAASGFDIKTLKDQQAAVQILKDATDLLIAEVQALENKP